MSFKIGDIFESKDIKDHRMYTLVEIGQFYLLEFEDPDSLFKCILPCISLEDFTFVASQTPTHHRFQPGDLVVCVGSSLPHGKVYKVVYCGKHWLDLENEVGYFSVNDFELHVSQPSEFAKLAVSGTDNTTYALWPGDKFKAGYGGHDHLKHSRESHWCQDHKAQYNGFTESYSYCTICDKKNV